MVAHLEEMGAEWVTRLNAELHSAQAARKQPIEDGYNHHVVVGGSRARLFIVAASARAQAHEAKHSSILKLMRTSGYKPKVHGDFENPTKGWLINVERDERGDTIHGLD